MQLDGEKNDKGACVEGECDVIFVGDEVVVWKFEEIEWALNSNHNSKRCGDKWVS